MQYRLTLTTIPPLASRLGIQTEDSLAAGCSAATEAGWAESITVATVYHSLWKSTPFCTRPIKSRYRILARDDYCNSHVRLRAAGMGAVIAAISVWIQSIHYSNQIKPVLDLWFIKTTVLFMPSNGGLEAQKGQMAYERANLPPIPCKRDTVPSVLHPIVPASTVDRIHPMDIACRRVSSTIRPFQRAPGTHPTIGALMEIYLSQACCTHTKSLESIWFCWRISRLALNLFRNLISYVPCET